MEERKDLQQQKQHIVMLPFMAQGHLIPFLALANQIHRRFGFTITIATTPLNVRHLAAAISKTPTNSGDINLYELPFNASDHGLPPNAENTESLPLNLVINLFHSSTSLEPSFRALIQNISADQNGRPPLCIISDVFMGWANAVAESFSTVNVTFTTGGAYGTTAYVSLWQHLPHRRPRTDDGEEFNLPGFPDSCVFHITQLHSFLRAADGTDSWSRFFQPQIGNSMKSFGWLCNTAEEIEPFGLNILKNYTNLPVWCIGPLIPPRMLNPTHRIIGQHTGRKPGISPEKCLSWLDSRPERSVLYISFGSQNTISPSQMMSLAMGLEDSKKPFIWVIRPPFGFDLKCEFKSEWLPNGFEERTSDVGMVVRGWAPQLEILCHKSTGAFLSHCGWNSTAESLSQGVPMIGWPLAAEQGYNAKMLVEEMGVCVELTRGLGSSISREEVKSVIESVMDGDKAEEMKKKAGEMRELMRAALSDQGSSDRAMDEFVSALLSKKQEIAYFSTHCNF